MAASRLVRMGAAAGVVTIFLALVGLIGNFTDVYLIGDEITFAGLMLVLPAFVAGLVAAAPRVEGGERHEMRLSEAADRGRGRRSGSRSDVRARRRARGLDRGRAYPGGLPQRDAAADGVRHFRASDRASVP